MSMKEPDTSVSAILHKKPDLAIQTSLNVQKPLEKSQESPVNPEQPPVNPELGLVPPKNPPVASSQQMKKDARKCPICPKCPKLNTRTKALLYSAGALFLGVALYYVYKAIYG